MAVQTLSGACHCGKVRIEADLDLAAGSGYLEQVGGDFCSVNLAVMDVEPATLATIPVRYFDGRHNNWMATPQFTGYL